MPTWQASFREVLVEVQVQEKENGFSPGAMGSEEGRGDQRAQVFGLCVGFRQTGTVDAG